MIQTNEISWEQHIENWKASGKSIAGYARENKLVEHQFRHRCKKEMKLKALSFAKVKVSEEVTLVLVVVCEDLVLELSTAEDPTWIVNLYRSVKNAATQ